MLIKFNRRIMDRKTRKNKEKNKEKNKKEVINNWYKHTLNYKYKYYLDG